MMCKAFFPTLKGSTQQWFMNLPPSSVHNFEGLAESFLIHFAGSMREKKHFTHLTTVKQGDNKSLKSFITRWQKEVRSVEELDEKSALVMFIEALRVGDLYISLKTDTPASYPLAMQPANRYVDTEEDVRQK